MSRSAVATIPAAKFARPHEQPGIIVRRRLLRSLDSGIERPLTLISAPPGSGKTALLGSWVASSGAPASVAWLSLDAGDGDRRPFWRAVLEALSRAGGGEAVSALAAHPPPRIERLVAALAEAIEEREAPLVLVLDDFHEVGEVVHVDLDRLLHRPPPQLHVVIATRADPPLRLGRLRMQGELSEIRAPELALTLDETTDMLEAVGVSLEDSDARRLWDRTEGWVGAMRLAALALRGHPDPASFVEDFAGDDRAISDYLLSEVMSRLSPEAPEQLPALHRRAASWFADHGDEARGLVHAVEAEAWDLAARLAGERWVDLLIRGEVSALEPLIERLPVEWAEEDPELALAVASALLDRGDHADAEEMLGNAETAAEKVPPERHQRFTVSVAAPRMHIARLRGDLDGAMVLGRALLDEGHLEGASVDAGLRALALLHLGIAELWAGEVEEAEHHLERSRGAAAEAGREWLVLMAVAHLALLGATTSEFARSARLAGEAIALAESRGWDRTWPAGAAYLALAGAEFLWDRGDKAALTLEHARVALSGTQEPPLRAFLALLRAIALERQGELESGLAVLGSALEDVGDWPLPPVLRDQFPVREAVLRNALGEPDQAARLLRGSDGEPGSLLAAVVLGQLRLADGDAHAARELIDAWSGELEQQRTPSAVQGWVVDALALDVLADHDGAAASLERALERAEPNGQRWALLDFGRPLQPLLSRQLRRGTAHRALVGELLEALDGAGGSSRPSSPFVIEPLSPRERAVLRYLPTMMSNQEIASELFVSVNTVKTHLKAIYRKLDVADRREAVRRARTLELLAP